MAALAEPEALLPPLGDGNNDINPRQITFDLELFVMDATRLTHARMSSMAPRVILAALPSSLEALAEEVAPGAAAAASGPGAVAVLAQLAAACVGKLARLQPEEWLGGPATQLLDEHSPLAPLLRPCMRHLEVLLQLACPEQAAASQPSSSGGSASGGAADADAAAEAPAAALADILSRISTAVAADVYDEVVAAQMQAAEEAEAVALAVARAEENAAAVAATEALLTNFLSEEPRPAPAETIADPLIMFESDMGEYAYQVAEDAYEAWLAELQAMEEEAAELAREGGGGEEEEEEGALSEEDTLEGWQFSAEAAKLLESLQADLAAEDLAAARAAEEADLEARAAASAARTPLVLLPEREAAVAAPSAEVEEEGGAFWAAVEEAPAAVTLPPRRAVAERSPLPTAAPRFPAAAAAGLPDQASFLRSSRSITGRLFDLLQGLACTCDVSLRRDIEPAAVGGGLWELVLQAGATRSDGMLDQHSRGCTHGLFEAVNQQSKELFEEFSNMRANLRVHVDALRGRVRGVALSTLSASVTAKMRQAQASQALAQVLMFCIKNPHLARLVVGAGGGAATAPGAAPAGGAAVPQVLLQLDPEHLTSARSASGAELTLGGEVDAWLVRGGAPGGVLPPIAPPQAPPTWAALLSLSLPPVTRVEGVTPRLLLRNVLVVDLHALATDASLMVINKLALGSLAALAAAHGPRNASSRGGAGGRGMEVEADVKVIVGQGEKIKPAVQGWLNKLVAASAPGEGGVRDGIILEVPLPVSTAHPALDESGGFAQVRILGSKAKPEGEGAYTFKAVAVSLTPL